MPLYWDSTHCNVAFVYTDGHFIHCSVLLFLKHKANISERGKNIGKGIGILYAQFFFITCPEGHAYQKGGGKTRIGRGKEQLKSETT